MICVKKIDILQLWVITIIIPWIRAEVAFAKVVCIDIDEIASEVLDSFHRCSVHFANSEFRICSFCKFRIPYFVEQFSFLHSRAPVGHCGFPAPGLKAIVGSHVSSSYTEQITNELARSGLRVEHMVGSTVKILQNGVSYAVVLTFRMSRMSSLLSRLGSGLQTIGPNSQLLPKISFGGSPRAPDGANKILYPP